MTESNKSEPSNAVLAEQIKQMRKEFNEFRVDTRKELRELDQEVEINRRFANEMSIGMTYVKETVKEMKDLLNGFVKVQSDQSKKIDDFVNSDTRRSSKNNLISSLYQATLGFIAALIVFWATGKF